MSEVDFLNVPPPQPSGGPLQNVPSRASSLLPLLALAIPGIGPLLAAVGVSAQGGRRNRGLNENAFIREANRRGQTVAGIQGDPGALESAAVGQRGRTRQQSIERAGLLRAQQQRVLAAEAVARGEAKTVQEQANRDREAFRQAREGLVNDVQPALTDLRTANTALRTILTASEDFAGDQAMVFNFARLITGGGGQGLSNKDVERLGGSGALGESIKRWLGTLESGRTLTPDDRTAIRRQTVQAYRQNREEIRMSQGPAIATAARIGLSTDELFGKGIFHEDNVLRAVLSGDLTAFDALPLQPVPGAGLPQVRGPISTVNAEGITEVRSAR